MLKTLKKLGRVGMYLDVINAVYGEPSANVLPEGEKFKLLL